MKFTKFVRTAAYCTSILFLSSQAIMAGDLEDNYSEITINGDTFVDTPMNGEGGFGVGFGKFAAGASLEMGGSTIVNGVEISCATLLASCGNRDIFLIDVIGDTTVTGTDAVVNGARFISGNALFD